MRIEFAGIPGAGKSVAFRALLETLRADEGAAPDSDGSPGRAEPLRPCSLEEDDADRRSVRYAGYLRAVAAHPRLTAFVVRRLVRSRSGWTDRWSRFRLFLVALHRCRVADQARAEPRMVDEGLVQRAFTVLVESPHGREVAGAESYARLIPAPRVVVYLRCPPEVALERLAARERGVPPRLAECDPSVKRDVFQAGAALLDRVVGVLEERGTTVVRVDGGRGVDPLRIAEGVQRARAHGPAAPSGAGDR